MDTNPTLLKTVIDEVVSKSISTQMDQRFGPNLEKIKSLMIQVFTDVLTDEMPKHLSPLKKRIDKLDSHVFAN